MKSKAPSLTASTADFTVPWPDRITTGSAGSFSLSRFSTSRPSTWGMRTSRNTRSGASVSASLRPTGPFAACSVS